VRFGHRLAGAGLALATALVAGALPAGAQEEAPAPSATGDLTGNLPWGVWLLLALVVALAVLTALALSAGGEAGEGARRQGGVSRALAQRDLAPPADPPPS
jgi:hypothetical protein